MKCVAIRELEAMFASHSAALLFFMVIFKFFVDTIERVSLIVVVEVVVIIVTINEVWMVNCRIYIQEPNYVPGFSHFAELQASEIAKMIRFVDLERIQIMRIVHPGIDQ